MLYRPIFGTNPRMILLPVVLAGLIAAGILAWRYGGTVVGLVVLAIAVYADIQLVRFMAKHLRSCVETTEQGLGARLPDGSTLRFAWQDLSHTGRCLRPGRRTVLFLYDGQQDRLLCIPDQYGHFGELQKEIRRRTPKATLFEEIRLGKEEAIEDWLKQKIG